MRAEMQDKVELCRTGTTSFSGRRKETNGGSWGTDMIRAVGCQQCRWKAGTHEEAMSVTGVGDDQSTKALKTHPFQPGYRRDS